MSAIVSATLVCCLGLGCFSFFGAQARLEIAVHSLGVRSEIAVGVLLTPGLSSQMPGWGSRELGYHLDNGNKYISCGHGQPYGPHAQVGDVVGCGYDVQSHEVFCARFSAQRLAALTRFALASCAKRQNARRGRFALQFAQRSYLCVCGHEQSRRTRARSGDGQRLLARSSAAVQVTVNFGATPFVWDFRSQSYDSCRIEVLDVCAPTVRARPCSLVCALAGAKAGLGSRAAAHHAVPLATSGHVCHFVRAADWPHLPRCTVWWTATTSALCRCTAQSSTRTARASRANAFRASRTA